MITMTSFEIATSFMGQWQLCLLGTGLKGEWSSVQTLVQVKGVLAAGEVPGHHELKTYSGVNAFAKK